MAASRASRAVELASLFGPMPSPYELARRVRARDVLMDWRLIKANIERFNSPSPALGTRRILLRQGDGAAAWEFDIHALVERILRFVRQQEFGTWAPTSMAGLLLVLVAVAAAVAVVVRLVRAGRVEDEEEEEDDEDGDHRILLNLNQVLLEYHFPPLAPLQRLGLPPLRPRAVPPPLLPVPRRRAAPPIPLPGPPRAGLGVLMWEEAFAIAQPVWQPPARAQGLRVALADDAAAAVA